MKQKYLFIIFFLSLSVSNLSAQEKKTTTKSDPIEGLQVYPNPTTNGRIYITSDNNSNNKEIELFDMLGKKVYATTLASNKEINLTSLNAGVYIIKIKENTATATRKLVIK